MTRPIWIALVSLITIHGLWPAMTAADEVQAPPEELRLFEFHGYLRSGFGLNAKLGAQESFILPGSGVRGGVPTRFRLGNEPETYGEAILVANWLGAPSTDSVTFKTQILLSFFAFDHANQNSPKIVSVNEAFAEAGGLFRAAPQVKIWAGQRYYRRLTNDILDFHYLDMSGMGGGVLDIPLGGGLLSVSFLGGSTGQDLTVDGFATKSSIDVRLADLPVAGKLTLWLAGSYVRGGTLPDGTGEVPSIPGSAIGLWHTVEGLLGGFQRLTVQAGRGALTDFQAHYKPTAFRLPADIIPGDRLVRDSWRLRVTEMLQIQPSPGFSLMGSAIYQVTDFAPEGGEGIEHWYSIGARPIVHFNRYASFAAEAGVEVIESELAADGVLAKISGAAQVTAGGLFFSRPVLRAYVTLATWSDALRGAIGGPAHRHDTRGLGMGLQLESWW